MTDISPVEETTTSKKEGIKFSSRVLAFFSGRREPARENERAIPAWQQKAIEGMSSKDRRAILKVRGFFQKNGGDHQRWYYAGANSDIVPTIIAPANTEHWWVDPVYDISSWTHQNSLGTELVQPFIKLGAEVQTAFPWKKAWQSKKQVITINKQAVIRLTGGLTQDESTVPETIDVIYINPYSVFPGPEVLMVLKIGGFCIVANDLPNNDLLILPNSEKPLTNFGFQKVASISVDRLSFPAIGKIRSTSIGKAITFQIYEKTRDFTPEETDLLQFDSCVDQINREFYEFVLRYKPEGYSPEENIKMENRLKNTLRRYFSRVNHPQSTNTALLEETKEKVAAYFETDDKIPQFTKSDSDNLFPVPNRNEEQVKQFCQRAKTIYQEVKKEYEE